MSYLNQEQSSQPMKLTTENYYDHQTDWQYMSVSIFKDFEKCEAAALAKLKEDWQPVSSPVPLLVGNYTHSFFESAESHQKFIEENRSKMMSTRGKSKGKLKADFRVADEMISALKSDHFFNEAYMPGDKEVIVTGKIDGYWWKGKIDSLVLDQGYFCDLKTVDDIHKPHWIKVGNSNLRTNFIEAREYNMQMAVYRELIKQTFGVDCQPFIFAVSKQTPPDKMAIDFNGVDDPYLMDDAMEKIKKLQPHIWKVMTGEDKPEHCGKCEYCRRTKELSGFVHASEIEL